MRAARATLLVATIALLTGATSAQAAPADVQVRIEGVTSTLFDRVVRTDGHAIRASSDRAERPCDGTNGGAHPAPGPTALAATVDALATLGQTFDGQWYPGFDDYFIRQLGPEREDNDEQWWWGILVNRAFTPTGGCQVRVADGAEVLWVNDAFGNRPFLWLAAAAPTPTVLVDTPLAVTVTSTAGNGGGGGSPYAGAQVSAVDVNGQPTVAGVADGGTSAAGGSASVTFHQAGWQRLKAHDPGPGAQPVAIASNSIDVCVEAVSNAGCAGPPPSRQPVGSPAGGGDPPVGGGDPPPGGGTPPGGDLPPAPRPRAPGQPPAAKPAWLRSFAPAALRDDRARGLSWLGSWRRIGSVGAWRGTLSRGSADALLRLRLGAGRAAFLLRLGTGRARIELRAGGRSIRVALPASASAAARVVQAPRLRQTGTVELRVLSGSVRVDGAGRAA